jgi:hypothetical protein
VTVTEVFVPRESSEWVQVNVTVTSSGVVVDGAKVKLAVLPVGEHPAATDWAAPVPDPSGGTGIGLQVQPVAAYQRLGVWVRVTDTSETPVLDPSTVGYITRT